MADRNALLRFVPRIDSTQSVAWRYGAAVLTSLAFIALRWLLAPVIGYDTPFAILFVPIALSAFYGGLGPGLVSVLTTVALADYFLIPPLYTLGLPDTKAVLSNLLFAVSGLVVSVVGELGRSATLQFSHEAELRKLAQHHAFATEERLRITEQVVSGGVWDWDIAHGYLYWSDGFQRLCDYPLDQVPSYELWVESLHPEDREQVVTRLNELFEQQLHNWSMEYRIRTATGRIRWVASRGRVYYDSAGKPRRMVGINFDVTAPAASRNAPHLAEQSIRRG